MVRAILLLVAALALAFLPVPKVIRIALVTATLILAAVLGWFAYLQEEQRVQVIAERSVVEEGLWQPAPPGLVRIVDWDPLAPLRFSSYWVVDSVAGVQSTASSELRGVEVTVDAYDCPAPDSPIGDCLILGQSSARATFLPLPPDIVRHLRLRFRFDASPFPAARLRLLPSVTALRRQASP